MAGFYVSPGDRLRVLRLLDGMGRGILHEPQKLKQLLCPVIAHSRADQERFYELFDHYWRELQQPWLLPELPRPAPWWERMPAWVRWLLPALLVAGMGFGIWKLIDRETVPEPDVVFSHPASVEVGDPIVFQNGSKNVDSTAMRWEILDARTQEVEHIEEDSFHLTFFIKKTGASPDKQVRLTALNDPDRKTGQPKKFESYFRIVCDRMPAVDSIAALREVKINTAANFRAFLPDTAGLTLAWDFGDGSTATGSTAKHSFGTSGTFEVRFTASRTGVEGFCEKTLIHRISAGQEVAQLATKTLLPDEMAPIVNFSWGTWILLGLLGLAMIWFWVKWAMRKAPPPPDESEDLSAAAERFRSVDRAPYFIPFRPQEGNVLVERDLYRLADVLRLRQEGLRKEFDVPNSVKKTIAEGGFPHLLTRRDSVPTEYLFLLDEQSQGSHQRRLFGFLVDFLQHREVLGELFFFNGSLHSFWNDQHPNGISPVQLRRRFPYHRLIVLGDGHALLDPHATGTHALRTEAVKLLSQWKHRMLLTPLPVQDWTFREGVLHRLFAIFPSHTDGLTEAAKHIELGIEDDERPAYAAWSERLAENDGFRNEPSVNYRRWRTAEEHRDYLKDHPALYRWLCALAVYPNPDWSVTLAIGRALSTANPQIAVNYDNLLILSRIPWLKTGDLSPRLRKELLADLGPEDERIARAAVQQELEAVQALVQGSHVNQEHQVNLALQNFALAPESPETQTAIRQLLGLNLLTKRHLAELDQTVERHLAQRGTDETAGSFLMKKSDGEAPGIRRFLEEKKTEAEPPKKPFFTQNFWIASTATLLYLLIFLFAWNMGGTDRLAEMAGVKPEPSTDCREEYLAAGFLKKECFADSAVIYNNLGVEAYNRASNTPDTTEKNRAMEFAWAYLERATELEPAYELAKSNFGKFHFNNGKTFYDFYHETANSLPAETAAQILNSAIWSFDVAAQFDSVRLDAWHGLGLAYFYQSQATGAQQRDSLTRLLNLATAGAGNATREGELRTAELQQALNQLSGSLDSATWYRDRLMDASGSQYFDDLDLPHLHSLLVGQDAANRGQAIVMVTDKKTGRPLGGVRVTSRDFTGETRPDGTLEVPMLLGIARTFDISKNGYLPTVQRFEPGPDNLLLPVQLEPEPEELALVSTESVIYFDFDKTTLRPDARAALDKVVQFLMKNESYQIEIAGHTENTGTEAYNVQVSRRLADTVAKYLADKGISLERITTTGRGETQPVQSNTTERGRLANRRVELKVVEPETPPQQQPVTADDDGDGVPNDRDKCPAEVGTAENGGCLPPQAPVPLDPPQKAAWQLVRTHFVAEPKILKNRDFYDRLTYDGYEYQVTLNELDRSGTASFTLEKDLKQQARYVAPVELTGMKKGDEREFEMDGSTFRFAYLGQARRLVNKLTRDVAVYALYVKEAGRQPTDFPLPEMVFVKGGTFRMGCDEQRDGNCKDDEKPVHDVALDDFYIGKYEVTNEEYAAFLNAYGSPTVKEGLNKGERMIYQSEWGIGFPFTKANFNYHPQNGYEKHPVVGVTWHGANEYTNWLSSQTGQKFRLPTEAEWEYAARGGSKTGNYRYSGSNNLSQVGWHFENADRQTHPVGQKQKNEIEIFDMSGNTWEWCNDIYNKDFYKNFEKTPARNPQSSSGDGNVVRGGSWNDRAGNCRSADRGSYKKEDFSQIIGFRIVRESN